METQIVVVCAQRELFLSVSTDFDKNDDKHKSKRRKWNKKSSDRHLSAFKKNEQQFRSNSGCFLWM